MALISCRGLLLGAGAAGVGDGSTSSGNGETGAIRAPRRRGRPMDRWTDDQLLERLWGDSTLGHLRRGSRGAPIPRRQSSFRCMNWCGWVPRINCPVAAPVVDCGLWHRRQCLDPPAGDYGFEVLGISIAKGQIAGQASSPRRPCPAVRGDGLPWPRSRDGQFDASGVWRPDAHGRQERSDEAVAVLAPEGLLAVADWNRAIKQRRADERRALG